MASTEIPSDFRGKRKIIADILIAGRDEEEARAKAQTTRAYVRKVKSQLVKLGILEKGIRGRDPNYSSPGQLAAKLFKSFMEGKSLAEAVVEHQLPYPTVREHYSDFLDSKTVSENNMLELIDFDPHNHKLQLAFDDVGGEKMFTCRWLVDYDVTETSCDSYCTRWKEKNPFVWEKRGMKYKTLADGSSIIQPTTQLCALCPLYQRREEE